MHVRHPTPPKTYFEPLTAFRGIAALFVFLFHTAHFKLGVHFVALTQIVAKSYVFVDFFFLLSGFVIAHAYGAEFRDGFSRTRFKAYLAARFARLYPLHVAMLGLVVLITIARLWLLDGAPMQIERFDNPETFSAAALLTNLLLLHGFGLHDNVTWNSPSWSISCEFYVYLLFPLLVEASVSRRRWLKTALLAGAAAALVAIFFSNVPHTVDGRLSFNLFRCLAEFTIGILLYEAHREGFAARWLARDSVAWATAAALVLSLHFGIPDLLLLPQFALLILVGAANRRSFRRMLVTRPLQYLGRISYSLYLVHFPVLYAAGVLIERIWGVAALVDLSAPGRLLATLACLPIVIGAAHFAHQKIEIGFSRALAGRLRRDGVGVPLAGAAESEATAPP